MANSNIVSVREFYENSPYSAFKREVCRGGTFNVEMLMVEQDGHDFIDPGYSQLSFVGAVKTSGYADLDFGDGLLRYPNLTSGIVHVQPALQECRFQVSKPHTILVAALNLDTVLHHLDEWSLNMSHFDQSYGRFTSDPWPMHLLRTMWQALKIGGDANNLLVDACSISLLTFFSKYTEFQWYKASSNKVDDKRLGRAMDYIETRFSDPIKMDELARLANLSVVQFSRLFKSATGQSPHAYLTKRRLHHSASYAGLVHPPTSVEHFKNTLVSLLRNLGYKQRFATRISLA
jgi:AraC family transcriptional regulator